MPKKEEKCAVAAEAGVEVGRREAGVAAEKGTAGPKQRWEAKGPPKATVYVEGEATRGRRHAETITVTAGKSRRRERRVERGRAWESSTGCTGGRMMQVTPRREIFLTAEAGSAGPLTTKTATQV